MQGGSCGQSGEASGAATVSGTVLAGVGNFYQAQFIAHGSTSPCQCTVTQPCGMCQVPRQP